MKQDNLDIEINYYQNFVSMDDFTNSDDEFQKDNTKAKQSGRQFNFQMKEEHTHTKTSASKVYPLIDESKSVPRKSTFSHGNAESYEPGQPQYSQQSQGESKKDYKTQILINPQNYNIRKNDIAYAICSNYDLLMNIENITSTKHEDYIRFIENFDLIRKTISTKKQRQQLIEDLFTQLEERQHTNQKIVRRNTVHDKQNLLYTKGIPVTLGNSQGAIKGQNTQIFRFKLLYPYANEKTSYHFWQVKKVNLFFSSIKKNNSFQNIVYVLRKYAHRKIILFTNEEVDVQRWTDICNQYLDVYYFKGDYLDLKHINLLNVHQSHQALITSELIDHEDFPDAVGICISRILLDYYDFNNFLMEIKDEQCVNFLSNNLKLKNMTYPIFLNKSFVEGNIHFSSMATSVLARVVYNESWVRLFQDLVVPRSYQKRVLNQTMNCLHLTKYYPNNRKSKRHLSISASSSLPCLRVSLLSQRFRWSNNGAGNFYDSPYFISSKYTDIKLNHFMKREQMKKAQREFRSLEKWESMLKNLEYNRKDASAKFQEYIQMSIGRVDGHRCVLSNPHFYTPLEEGDIVLIIGEYKRKADDDQMISLATLGRDRNASSKKETTMESIHDDEMCERYENVETRKKIKQEINDELIKRIKSYSNFSEKFKSIIDQYTQ